MYLTAHFAVGIAAKAISPELPLVLCVLLSGGLELLRVCMALIPSLRVVEQYESTLSVLALAGISAATFLMWGRSVQQWPMGQALQVASTVWVCVASNELLKVMRSVLSDGDLAVVWRYLPDGSAVALPGLQGLHIPLNENLAECGLSVLMTLSAFLMAGECMFFRPELRHRTTRRQKRSFALFLLFMLLFSTAPMVLSMQLPEKNKHWLRIIYALLGLEAVALSILADLRPDRKRSIPPPQVTADASSKKTQ